jgi:hypothetical protein
VPRVKWTPEQRAQLSERMKEYYKDHPHPRVGTTHTPETKRQISQTMSDKKPQEST